MRINVRHLYTNDLVARVIPQSSAIEYAFVKCPRNHPVILKSTPHSCVTIHMCPTERHGTFAAREVLLMDRYLEPDDNVMMHSATMKSGVFGYCENVDSYVTIHVSNTDKIIENVDSRHLTDTREFHVNSFVVGDSLHVGKIFDVRYKVTFQSSDGSIFIIDDPKINHFIHKNPSKFFVKKSRCYIGEIFKMCPESLDDAKFIRISNFMKIKLCLKRNCTNKYSSLFGSKWILVLVQDASVSSVHVDWHWQVSNSKEGKEISCPEVIIKGKDLKKLKQLNTTRFHKANIGDKYFYTIKDTDNLITMEEWHKKYIEATLNPVLRAIINKKPKTSEEPSPSTSSLYNTVPRDLYNSQNSSVTDVHKTKSLTKKKNRYSIELMESQLRNPTRKTKRYSTYKLKLYTIQKNCVSFDKKKKEFDFSNISLTTGSTNVVTICATKRFADIIWNNGKRTTHPTIFLHKIPKISFEFICPRSYVIKKNDLPNNYGFVKSVDLKNGTVDVQWYKIVPDTYTEPIHFDVVTTMLTNLRPHCNFTFTFGGLVSSRIVRDPGCSYIGQQLSIGSDGRILVIWADGEKTECWPQNLYVLEYDLAIGNLFYGVDKMKLYDSYDNFGHVVVEYDYDAADYTHGFDDTNLQEHNTRRLYPILPNSYLLNLLKQVYTSIASFVENIKYVDKMNELQTSVNEISTLLPTSEIKEKELLNNNLNILVQMIDKFNLSSDNNEKETDELFAQTLFDASRTIFKRAVTDAMHSVHIAMKDL